MIDLAQFIARAWRRATLFSTGDKIRSRNAGFEYEATTGGQTGSREPIWPRKLGDTVADGSVVWTARAVSTASLLKTVASAVWTAPASITVSGEAVNSTKQTALAYLSLTIAGSYEVTVLVTFSDSPSHKESFTIKITVT